MKRLIIALTLAGTAAGALTGCGGDDKKDPAKTPEVAWATKVCGAVDQGSAKVVLPSTSSDPKQYKKNVVVFLGDVSTRLKSMEAALQGVGSPPVSGGQGSVDQALAKLRTTRASVEQARARLNKVQVTDQKSLQREMQKLSKVMVTSATYRGPKEDLRANPALTKAFDNAANCKTAPGKS
ncbi:hypothetical protein ACQEU3_19390 [Spirillospora sp. CA-253888]